MEAYEFHKQERVELYLVPSNCLLMLLRGQVRATGVPADAEIVRSWYEPQIDSFVLLVRSVHAPEGIRGILPCAKPLTFERIPDESNEPESGDEAT